MSLCTFYLKDVIPGFASQIRFCLWCGVGAETQLVPFPTAPQQPTVQQIGQPQRVHLKLSKLPNCIVVWASDPLCYYRSAVAKIVEAKLLIPSLSSQILLVIAWKVELCALRGKIDFIQVVLFFMSAFSSVDSMLQYRILIRPGEHLTWACSGVDSDIIHWWGWWLRFWKPQKLLNVNLQSAAALACFHLSADPFFFQPSAPPALQTAAARQCLAERMGWSIDTHLCMEAERGFVGCPPVSERAWPGLSKAGWM